MFKNEFDKNIKVVVRLMKCLQDNEVTYFESKKILNLLIRQLEFQKQELEYDTVKDFMAGKKSRCLDNDVIEALNEI